MREMHKKDLMDKTRNNRFIKVVCDKRSGKYQLIGRTDDLIIIYDVTTDEDAVYGVLEDQLYTECKDALNVLQKWKGLKGQYEERLNFEKCLNNTMKAIREWDISFMVDDNEESSTE